ncbi:MAG: tyrosine-type recombinase/integrase, partial [Acidimicrobiales bacterium]
MASIMKRTDGRWRARYRDNAGKEHARHFTRKVDAQSWIDSVTTAIGTGTYVDPGRARVTVDKMADQWIAGKVNIRITTRIRYQSALKAHVLPRWGTVQLDRIEHGDLQAWVAEMAKTGMSGSTVRKNHGVLSSILRLAVREKRIPSNPSDGLNLPALNERRRRYLTAQQVADLAEAAGDHRLVVLVLAYCGLRWSEMAGLRAANVNLMRRRLD